MHAPGILIHSKINQLVSVLFLLLCLIPAAQSKTLLVLGDSLSAAYGIQTEEGWVALLEKQLLKAGKINKVINASISGETTDGGLRALPGLLKMHNPEIVIIELGANDGLRGFPIKVIENNLARLVELAQQHQSKVLLVGMHIPPNYGKRYASAFHQLYSKTATQYNTALLPFMLEGIAVHPELMQSDKLHPKAEAQESIKTMIWEQLESLINETSRHAS